MSPVAIGILAIGMSLDAFVASLGRGAGAVRPGFGHALRAGALFGLVEATTPLIGWTIGIAAAGTVAMLDHWIAFALLSAVGARMILHAVRREADAPPPPCSTLALLATAVGTSVDAMAVGVSLAVLKVNILAVAIAIGVATLAMSTTGILAGGLLGRRFGRVVEVLGGVLLIGFGTSILAGHLLAN